MPALTTSQAYFLAASLAGAAPAPANGDVAAAAEAFSHAQRAELGHDFARAAEFYELADGLAPSAEALRSAAKNRFAAEQMAIAATRAAALLRRYPRSEKSRKLAAAILDKASPALARVSATCDKPCVLSTDGVAVADDRALSHVFYLEPGQHSIVASFAPGRQREESAAAQKGTELQLRFIAPDADAPPASAVAMGEPDDADGVRGTDAPARDPARSSRSQRLRRLHPAYFAVGAVLTAGSGAVLIWSGVDVLAQNQDYESDPTEDRFTTGRSAERRTNAFIATTAILGATTIVLAVFTDWARGKSKRRAAVRGAQGVALAPGPGTIGVRF